MWEQKASCHWYKLEFKRRTSLSWPVTLLALVEIQFYMRNSFSKAPGLLLSEMFVCKMIIRLQTMYCHLYSHFQLHALWGIHWKDHFLDMEVCVLKFQGIHVCVYVPNFIRPFMKSTDHKLDLEMDSFQRIWSFPPCKAGGCDWGFGMLLPTTCSVPGTLGLGCRVPGWLVLSSHVFPCSWAWGLTGWAQGDSLEAEPDTEYSSHISFPCSAITRRCWWLPGTLPGQFGVKCGCWREQWGVVCCLWWEGGGQAEVSRYLSDSHLQKYSCWSPSLSLHGVRHGTGHLGMSPSLLPCCLFVGEQRVKLH